MNDKKNIDRLFQEKFKDFDVAPSEIVWEKIKAHQQQDKKKPLILPLWYKVGGIAALIAIIFGIGYLPFGKPMPQNTTITKNEDIINVEDIDEVPNDNSKPTIPSKKEQFVVSSGSEQKKNMPSGKQTETRFTTNQHPYNHTSVTENRTTKIVHTEHRLSENSSIGSSPTSDAVSNQEQNNSYPSQITLPKHEQLSSVEKKQGLTESPIHENSTNDLPVQTTDAVTVTDKNNTSSQMESKNETNPDIQSPEKTSIFDAITQKEEIADTDDEKNNALKKWNIAPTVAPVYYNSIGDGSPIDDQFTDNNKNGQVNMSYGVQVAYNINKKLRVRSGINRVDLSYSTSDIGFSPSAVGQNLESVRYDENAGAILIADMGSVRNTFEITSDFNRNSIDKTQNPGLLNQSIGYLEVPLEMEYALVDKKIGVHVIGGVSTLFLQNNAITVEAGDFITPIGEANNLNPVSFSGNVGLGMGYKITKQFEFTLEPIFKYQLNAFSENANSFRPYYFGVYSGVSFKF